VEELFLQVSEEVLHDGGRAPRVCAPGVVLILGSQVGVHEEFLAVLQRGQGAARQWPAPDWARFQERGPG
jgi:hypothetical protein